MIARKVFFLTAFLAFFSSIAYGQLSGQIDILMMTVDSGGHALGTVDITDNSIMVGQVQYSTSEDGPWIIGSAQNFQTWLHDGYANGQWNGVGIMSSVAASDQNGLTGINWCTGQEYIDWIGLATFHGVQVNPNDILASYGYYGDSNMDGEVNELDDGYIDMAFGIKPGPINIADFNDYMGTSYTALGTIFGDFDYNGIVDANDYALVGREAPAVSEPSLPEPSTFVLLSMGAFSLLVYIRRRLK